MRIIRILFFIFLLAGFFRSQAQTTSTPVNLGDVINSEYEELSPVLSGDGNRLFFVRMNHPDNRYGRKNSQDIWMAERDEQGNWGEAERLPDRVNISRYNAIFWANETGTEIIIKGVFNKSGKEWKERGFSRIVSNDNDKWGKPKKIKIKGFENKNDGNLSSAFFSDDEKTLVLSFSATTHSKKSDIYISKKKNNKYSRPRKIKTLSTKYDEQAPFLSADGNTLYFSSNPGGNYNIYQSQRLDSIKEKWSPAAPVNLGVNTSGWESYFRLVDDGKEAFFVSNESSIGNSDIFKINISNPEEPKESQSEEWLVFDGIIKDEEGLKLPFTNFRLIIDSVDTEYINQSPDSAQFEVRLPKKEEYSITANLPGYQIDTLTLFSRDKDLRLFDIQLTARKLVVEPLKVDNAPPQQYRIFGKILEKNTQSALPAGIFPTLQLEYADVDSSGYDPVSGDYFLIFTSSSSAPILNVLAEGFDTFIKSVPLPAGNNEVYVPVHLSKKSFAVIVYGKVMNSRTNQPLEDLQGLSLLVNGSVFTDFVYVKEEKSYQINLEKGKSYTLEPQLKGFYGVNGTVDLSSVTTERIEKDLFLAPVEVGQSVKLENIFFKTGSSDLLNESIPELRRVSNFLKENPSMVIEIGGHTDNIGSDAYNLKLSEERAKSVARYIILSGVPRERIEFKGYGETQPVVSNDSAAGREQNRRVEFKVLRN